MGICSKCEHFTACLRAPHSKNTDLSVWDGREVDYDDCFCFYPECLVIHFPCHVGDRVCCMVQDENGEERMKSYYVSEWYARRAYDETCLSEGKDVWYAHLIEENDSPDRDEKDVPLWMICHVDRPFSDALFVACSERSKYYVRPDPTMSDTRNVVYMIDEYGEPDDPDPTELIKNFFENSSQK